MEDFEETQTMGFSWSGFFGVTSASCFIFSLFLNVTDDQIPGWLFLTGATTLLLAFFSYLFKKQKLTKKKLRKRSSIFNEE